jgi:hypothetical protein
MDECIWTLGKNVDEVKDLRESWDKGWTDFDPFLDADMKLILIGLFQQLKKSKTLDEP